MKSSLIDDEDEGKMQGVIANQDAMVDQDQAADQEVQNKQMSAGQSYESGILVSSQSQAAGSNAPIEIRKKQEEGKQDGEEGNADGDQAETKKNDLDAVKDQRDKLKKVAMRIFHQIKSGCGKHMCLNVHCRNNPFAADSLQRLTNDKEIFAEAMKLLQANKNDPDVILCAES